MAELNPQPLPPIDVTVRVPIEILRDLDAYQKVERSILGKLGCEGCNSGILVNWRHFEEWFVTPDLDVQPVIPQQRFGG
ncbi:MAG: hypothetical protein KDB63_04325 [Nocardioidaceae bacterium]|nr:hypothetical protein [Nocardioidaceae bacterium]